MRPEDVFPLLAQEVRGAERRGVRRDRGAAVYEYNVFSFGERGTRMSADLIREIRSGLVDRVEPCLSKCDCIVAPASSGNRWALLVADAVSRPLVVIQPHRSAEDRYPGLEGQRAVFIDDVVSGGSTAASLVDEVNRSGGRVIAILAIVLKGRDQRALSTHRNIPIRCLLRLDDDGLWVVE